MKKYCIYLFLLLLTGACRKAYLPAAITAANNYLVVDGFINATPNAVTSFTLSRSRNLVDTVVNIPELLAQVSIESKTGNTYSFNPVSDGVYNSQPLNLSASDEYRIKISTADNHVYTSDFVPVKISPDIDSITWEQDRDVKIYVNAHDPANNTRYYRWDYVETWEYHAPFETVWGVNGNTIYAVDLNTQGYKCWANVKSSHIVLGNTIALNEDVVSKQLLQTIIKDDERISVKYSMLLSQYAITDEAYKYWLIIQRNSQQLGTLFDLQPSQLKGNIVSTTDPNEPVIGFIGASTAPSKRLFINNLEVIDWIPAASGVGCNTQTIPADPLNFSLYTYPDPSYAPYYFTASGALLVVAKKECIDCRLKGGSNQRPSFW